MDYMSVIGRDCGKGGTRSRSFPHHGTQRVRWASVSGVLGVGGGGRGEGGSCQRGGEGRGGEEGFEQLACIYGDFVGEGVEGFGVLEGVGFI